MQKAKEDLVVKLSEDVIKCLKTEAERQGLTVSDLVTAIIAEWQVKKAGCR